MWIVLVVSPQISQQNLSIFFLSFFISLFLSLFFLLQKNWCTKDIFEVNNADIPFSALYLLEQNKLVLKSSSSIPKGHAATPLEMSLNGNSHPSTLLISFMTPVLTLSSADDLYPWPAHSVMRSGTYAVVEGLEAKLGHLPGGLWTESSQAAVLMPILGADRRAVGVLVLGVNLKRALDDDYMYSPPSFVSITLDTHRSLFKTVVYFLLLYTTPLIYSKGIHGAGDWASSTSDRRSHSVAGGKEACSDTCRAW